MSILDVIYPDIYNDEILLCIPPQLCIHRRGLVELAALGIGH